MLRITEVVDGAAGTAVGASRAALGAAVGEAPVGCAVATAGEGGALAISGARGCAGSAGAGTRSIPVHAVAKSARRRATKRAACIVLSVTKSP